MHNLLVILHMNGYSLSLTGIYKTWYRTTRSQDILPITNNVDGITRHLWVAPDCINGMIWRKLKKCVSFKTPIKTTCVLIHNNVLCTKRYFFPALLLLLIVLNCDPKFNSLKCFQVHFSTNTQNLFGRLVFE